MHSCAFTTVHVLTLHGLQSTDWKCGCNRFIDRQEPCPECRVASVAGSGPRARRQGSQTHAAVLPRLIRDCQQRYLHGVAAPPV